MEQTRKNDLSEFKIRYGEYLAIILYEILNMPIIQNGFLEKQLYKSYTWRKYFSQMAVFEFFNFLILKGVELFSLQYFITFLKLLIDLE